MNYEENNKRMALFMGGGKHLGSIKIGNTWMQVEDWQPHLPENLGQLFQVVDKIREKTGIGDFGRWQGDKYYFSFDPGFEEPIGIGISLTREEAIYAACIAAIDHLEGKK